MRNSLGLVVILGATACLAQQPQATEGARELFFVGTAPKDALPPIPKPAPRAGQKTPTRPAPAAGAQAAVHLGLRYTLLLVTSPGDAGEPADPDRNFRKGDCVAISLESNRSGYLYVLARQSSGDWIPLFPTPEPADRNNRIDPGQTVRTPKSACFEIEDPPGTETMFVVLSRNPRDIGELAEGVKAPGETPQLSSGPTQVAAATRINSAVEQIAQEAGTRELPFKQVVQPAPAPRAAPKPAEKKEPEHAVYVVTGSNKPEYTLVTKVEIRHK